MKRASFIFLFGAVSAFPTLTLAQEQYLEVRARVGDVISGPTTEKDDDLDKEEESKPQAITASQAMVSIEPANINGAQFTTSISGRPEFSTAPAFRGETNIQNANIILTFSYEEFIYQAVVRAGPNGKWNFHSPVSFPNGASSVLVRATHPDEPQIAAETSLVFSVQNSGAFVPWTEGLAQEKSNTQISLLLRIEEAFKVISPGENIIASVDINLEDLLQEDSNISLEYSIWDKEGKSILSQNETVTLTDSVSLFKTFYTQPSIAPGEYTLTVKAKSQNFLSSAGDSFKVEGEKTLPLSPVAKVDYTAVLLTLGGVFFTFTFLSYFEFARFLRVKNHIRTVRSQFLKRFF